MHNFVYLAQRRSEECSCEPNFGGGSVPPAPLAAPLLDSAGCRCACRVASSASSAPTTNLHTHDCRLRGVHAHQNQEATPLSLLLPYK